MMRPRCREWLPLASQQLRLRNLVRIHGLNIECGSVDARKDRGAFHSKEDLLIYYTLHYSQHEAAFYQSEPMPQRHKQQKWAEINCEEILKSNANCICVKVWMRRGEMGQERESRESQSPHQTARETESVATEISSTEPISALSQRLCPSYRNSSLSPHSLLRPPDQLLFTWGVYFSGLVLLSQGAYSSSNNNRDIKYQPNTLIFQLNGDFFTSSEKFTTESLREQLSLNCERHAASMPPMRENFNSSSALDINSPQVSRSSSPLPLRENEQRFDLLGMSKMRYVELQCRRSEVRKSYKLQHMLQIQNIQRMQLLKQRECEELQYQIKQLSVRCVSQEEKEENVALPKPRTVSTSLSKAITSTLSSSANSHSMGRALSILFREQEQQRLLDPQSLKEADLLQKQVETLKGRQRLLKNEYESYSRRITKLRVKVEQMREQRQEKELELEKRLKALERDEEQLEMWREQLEQLKIRRSQVAQQMQRRRSVLCVELRQIYPIYRTQTGSHHTICGVPFPHIDAYVNGVGMENITPMAVSAALGYVAHLVQMMAKILNCPLRNPIIHEGSRSRICDLIRDLPSITNREFPLFTRSSLPSKVVRYGIFLLNQNVSQLCYDITGVRCDLRATIENLLLIFTTLEEIQQARYDYEPKATRHQQLMDQRKEEQQLQLENGNGMDMTDSAVAFYESSHSSMDVNHHVVRVPSSAAASASNPQLSTLRQIASSQTIMSGSDEHEALLENRVSRSVGSYSDSDEDFRLLLEHQRNHRHQIKYTDLSIHSAPVDDGVGATEPVGHS